MSDTNKCARCEEYDENLIPYEIVGNGLAVNMCGKCCMEYVIDSYSSEDYIKWRVLNAKLEVFHSIAEGAWANVEQKIFTLAEIEGLTKLLIQTELGILNHFVRWLANEV